MQVEDLLAYQLVPSVVSAVRAAGIDRLWPLQEKAVRAGALYSEGGATAQKKDLLIAGPSASGKTFLLELCAVQAAHSGRRVVCVVPTDDRAAELVTRLRTRYQRLGLRIGHEGSEELLDVAVLGAGRLAQRLVETPELLIGIDLVLVDELEAVGDPRLGPTIELALLWLQNARSSGQKRGEAGRPGLLAMCTEVAGLGQLAAGLGIELITDERRACELRSGVVHGGRLHYFSSRDDRGSGRRYEEELHELPRSSRATAASQGPAALLRLTSELCMRGEQTLVLLPDKARAVVTAEQITAALRSCSPAPARTALARLAQTADGQARTLLRETLSRGVALLDAGLLPSQQALVVDACRDGEVRVLCATYSGELGQDLMLDLAFRNVIVNERWTWRYQRRTRGYAREELGWLDWSKLGGRAARAGTRGSAVGRVMVVVPSRYDAEVVLRQQAAALPEPLPPPLRAEPLDEVVLSLVAGGACWREGELVEALAASFSGQTLWSSPSGAADLRSRVGAAVESLVAHELLQRDFAAGAILRPTALGRATAGFGLPVRTILLMVRWAEAARDVDFTSLEVLLALALSPSGTQALVPLLLSEQESSDYWSRTLIRAAAIGAAERPLFRWLREQAGTVRFEQTRALKKALLLGDWAAGRDGAQLEIDYCVWLGAIARAATEFARLVAALHGVCALRGWSAARLQALDALADRLLRDQPESGKLAAGSTGKSGTSAGDDTRDSDSGSAVARAVFSIRAAILAGRGAVVGPAVGAAVSGQAPGSRATAAQLAIADHAVEPT